MHQHRASIATPSGGRVSPTGGRVLGPAHVVAGRLWCGAPRRSPRLASGTQDPVKWANISDHWYYESARWPDEVHLFVCSFDQPAAFSPQAHVNLADSLTWPRLADDLPRHDRFQSG